MTSVREPVGTSDRAKRPSASVATPRPPATETRAAVTGEPETESTTMPITVTEGAVTWAARGPPRNSAAAARPAATESGVDRFLVPRFGILLHLGKNYQTQELP